MNGYGEVASSWFIVYMGFSLESGGVRRMKKYHLGWLLPLVAAVVSGCGWVDSSGRQENRSPGLSEFTQQVMEGRKGVFLDVIDQDGNLETFDHKLLSAAEDLGELCIEAGGAFAGLQPEDFARGFEKGCDSSFARDCGVTLEVEMLRSELWLKEAPVIRRPIALQYRLTMQDTDGALAEQVMTLCIASESTAPVAANDQFNVEYGSVRVVEGMGFNADCGADVSSGVLANDTDDFDFSEDEANEQRCLVAELVRQPEHHKGEFSLAENGGFSYEAAASLRVGQGDSFTYVVSDGINKSEVATVSLLITGENAAPVDLHAERTIDEDTELFLLASDLASDKEGGLVLKTAVALAPSKGVVEKLQNPARLRYTPHAEEFGSDSFGYRIEDAGGAFVDVVVSVVIKEINDIPTITTEQGSGLELEVGEEASFFFTVEDKEDDDSGLTVDVVSDKPEVVAVDFVTLEPSSDWKVTLTAAADGDATLTITVTDSDAESDTVTVGVVVGTGNQLPTVESPSPSLAVVMGSELVIHILDDNIADDPDGDEGSLVVSSLTDAQGGSASFLTGSQELTFSPSEEGVASFELEVTDEGGASASATLFVEVAAATDEPEQGGLLSVEHLDGSGEVFYAGTVTWLMLSIALLGSIAVQRRIDPAE